MAPGLFFLFFTFFAGHLATAQSVTGTVVDAGNQEPIIGASILEKGTYNGTTTDFDGRFELNLTTDEAVLVVSYVGYQAQEDEYKGEELLIQHSGGLAWDEIVVTALGIKREKSAWIFSTGNWRRGSGSRSREQHRQCHLWKNRRNSGGAEQQRTGRIL